MKSLKTLFLTMALCASANAAVVFDNGAFSGTQIGRFNGGSWTIYDDFSVSSNVLMTGVTWSQHDSDTYTSTDLTIYAGTVDSGNLIFSGNFVATRIPNSTGTLFGNYEGFDYAIQGLNIALTAGTYYIGLHGPEGSTWDETEGNASTIPGRLQYGDSYPDEDSVFQIHTDTSAVPEPSSMALMILGGLAITGARRFTRTRQS